MSERLDAYLSRRGLGSRSEVRDLIRGGRVRCDGRIVTDAGARALGDSAVDGRVIVAGVDAATLLLHKPVGHACSTDEREAPLIGALVPEAYRHLALASAGRLDRETSGLLILSSDGALVHALTSPRKHIPKRYRIAYAGALSARAVERCARGLRLDGDDEPTLPARLELEPEGADGLGRATLHLTEGRYHQVRRMIAALGGSVVRLHRDRVGALELPPDLAPGALRELTAAELAAARRWPDGLELPTWSEPLPHTRLGW
jgi:16S rRNA pseudouridine516 synthase